MKHKHNKTLTILIILLVIVAAYTGFQVYKYWFTPRTIEVKHFMQVEVVTDKNLTLQETLGYTNDGTHKYVIIAKGSIYFYSLSPTQDFTRELEVKNIWRKPVEVTFTPTGDMAPWFKAEGPTTLKPKQSEIYNLTITIPETAIAGKYMGNLTVRLTPV